jgi:hypothetical protein
MRFTKYYYMAVYIVAPDVLVHLHANRTNRSLRGSQNIRKPMRHRSQVVEPMG